MRVSGVSILLASLCLVATQEEPNYRKLGPSTGDLSLRTRKDLEYANKDLREDDDAERVKRAPAGFTGVRGKKPFEGWIQDQGFLAPSGQEHLFKRAPNGFLGMRGKKDVDKDDFYIKRAFSSFNGVRGKKPDSRFFGMRGKKYPYEFRGKFVGVRGKKSYPVKTGPKLDINQMMLLLTENEDPLSQQQQDYNAIDTD